jgi:hypothetical protein
MAEQRPPADSRGSLHRRTKILDEVRQPAERRLAYASAPARQLGDHQSHVVRAREFQRAIRLGVAASERKAD